MAKIGVFVVVIITILLGLITFALSCWEVKNEFQKSYFEDGKGCDDMPVPFRATYQEETYVVQCGWSVSRTATRLLYLLVFFIVVIIYFVSIFKEKTALFLVSTILIFLDGILGFYSFIADGKATYNGNDYCKNSFILTILGSKVKHECSPGRFYGAVALSVITVFLMFIVVLISFIKRSSIFLKKSYTEI